MNEREASRTLPDLRLELEAAAAQVALTRRALAGDALPEIGDLPARLDALQRRVITAPAASIADLRPLLIALLDDLSSLHGELTAQKSGLEARLQEAGARRRADAAYRHADQDRR